MNSVNLKTLKALAAVAALLACCAVHAAPVAAADARITRMGRTVEMPDGALRFAYPGVRLSLAFTGRALSFEALSSGTLSNLEAVVDGGTPQLIKLNKERARYTLVDADKPGRHTIELMLRSETWQGVVTLAGFETDGQLEAAPPLPVRKMLVLGDSVTCAAGVDRSYDRKESAWTDPRHSYGMLAAHALNAQVHLVCYGGRGLVRSWNNRTDEFNLPDFYELAIADAGQPVRWDHTRYDPDLIVSAIGTNDFNSGAPDRTAYVATYVSLVRKLLRNHPHAQIVLTEGAILNGDAKRTMQSYIAETVEKLADPRVRAVASTYYPGDAGDAHPTGPQHAEMARELVLQVKPMMDW
jgi:lysophospholipase L1-like esterase